MATSEQRKALLAIACPWCRAAPGEECSTGRGTKRMLITTLDGGCHDARWRASVGTEASVIRNEDGHRIIATEPATPEREPVAVGAAIAERPW